MSASVASSRTLRPTIYVGQRGCVVRAGTTDGPAKFSGYNHQRQALMYAYSMSRFAGPVGSNDTSDIDVIHVDDAVLADLAAGKLSPEPVPEPVKGYTLKAADAYARVKGTVFEGRTEQPLDQPPPVTSPMGETAIIPPIANIPQFSKAEEPPLSEAGRRIDAHLAERERGASSVRADSTTAKDPIEAVRAKIMDDMRPTSPTAEAALANSTTSLRLLKHRIIEPGTDLSGMLLMHVQVEPGSTIMEAASRAAKILEEKIAAGLAEALQQELEKRNAPRGKSYSTAEALAINASAIPGPVFPGLDVAAELEQARVQLAGCLTAAENSGRRDVDRGSYGWSPAYEAVLRLAARNGRQRLLIEELQYELQRSKEKHGKASELIAKMHGAAMGEFGDGPRRGVLEDVIDLRQKVDRQDAVLNQLTLALDRCGIPNPPAMSMYDRLVSLVRVHNMECERLQKVALQAEHDRDLARRARNEISAINDGHRREIAQLRDQLIERKSDLAMANDAAHQWQRMAEENEKRYNAIRQELLKKENSHASRVNATS